MNIAYAKAGPGLYNLHRNNTELGTARRNDEKDAEARFTFEGPDGTKVTAKTMKELKELVDKTYPEAPAKAETTEAETTEAGTEDDDLELA